MAHIFCCGKVQGVSGGGVRVGAECNVSPSRVQFQEMSLCHERSKRVFPNDTYCSCHFSLPSSSSIFFFVFPLFACRRRRTTVELLNRMSLTFVNMCCSNDSAPLEFSNSYCTLHECGKNKPLSAVRILQIGICWRTRKFDV